MKSLDIPFFRRTGRAYLTIVVLPALMFLVLSLSIVFYSYMKSINHLAEFSQRGLHEMLLHLAADLGADRSSRQIVSKMEVFSRVTSQSDAFRRHIVLVEGTTIVAGTDDSVIGTSYRPESHVFQGFSLKGDEASVSASVSLGGGWMLVAHQYITESVSAERTKAMLLALYCLLGGGLIVFLQHFAFRLRVIDSIQALAEHLKTLPLDSSTERERPVLPAEFAPTLAAWEQTIGQLAPSVQEFVQAEKKSAVILLTNAFRHCLSRVSDLLSPVAALPTKALSASEINMMQEARTLLRKLYEKLDDIDVNADPLTLCQRILNADASDHDNRVADQGKLTQRDITGRR